jgi:PAS domain S-box-containing protein
VVLDEGEANASVRDALGAGVEIIHAASPQAAVDMLTSENADGVLGLLPVQSVKPIPHLLVSSDEILSRLASPIAVVDTDFRILWHNPSFGELFGSSATEPLGLYEAIGCEEVRGPDFCPLTDCLAGRSQAMTRVRLKNDRHVELCVQTLASPVGSHPYLLCLLRDITSEVREREKLIAIHRAGLELGHLTSAELAQMTTEERIDLLKANILQHSQKILNFRFLEIRTLDPQTQQLRILLSEGMTESAIGRTLFASREGNGVTGFVAATAESYLADDVQHDPLYLPGAPGARSCLTVPMLYRDRVVGTFNVESTEVGHFTDSNRQFLEIFAREIAVALHTLDLLEAEKSIGGSATVEAITSEVSLPVDEIVADTVRVLDFLLQPAAEKEPAQQAVRRTLLNARAIKTAIQKVGQKVEPPAERTADQPTRLTGKRVLVVDADPEVRRSAHVMLSQLGCEVDAAKDAQESQQLARTIGYDVIVGDIRLPDLSGYEFFSAMKEIAPRTPIVLMTGFGWDANHSIVRARQEGLASVLYKPFRLDRIREAVADAIVFAKGTPTNRPAIGGIDMAKKQTIL